jgi:thiopeptide-type bacteriocin biosynthesis protein
MCYSVNDHVILRLPLMAYKSNFEIEELKNLFGRNDIKEALFLSSPTLYSQLEKMNWEYSFQNKGLILKFLKYVIRFHTRCTPFGLFAGCGVLNFSDKNQILFDRNKISRFSRLDMDFTCSLAIELSKSSLIKPYLRFFPNNSCYRHSNRIRYIESISLQNRRTFQISSVNNSPYLNLIMDYAKNGATISELCNLIVCRDISLMDAEEFVLELIECQILVSELEPSVSGENVLDQILSIIIPIQKDHQVVDLLDIIKEIQKIKVNLSNVDVLIGNNPDIYITIEEEIKKLNVSFVSSKIYQTDLIYNFSGCSLDSKHKKIALDALGILNRLTFKEVNNNLNEFKNKFSERYGDKFIPLSEVMDSETGIGYSTNNGDSGTISPLLDGLIFPVKEQNDRNLDLNKIQSFFTKKILDSVLKQKKILYIFDAELEQFPENWDDLPDTFTMIYRHLGEFNGQELFYIENVGGSSGIPLIGRFASTNQKILDVVKSLVKKEEDLNVNAINAEILHLPENRIGNVILRPNFRDFEIPYLSKSQLSPINQIYTEDLLVGVRDNRIVLISKKLNKEIIPRLGNAHNYLNNTLPIYQFLCELQSQGKRTNLFIDLGQFQSKLNFIPRIQYKNIILSRARWLLNPDDLSKLVKNENSNYESILKLKDDLNLPEKFLIIEGDKELLIDTNNNLSLDLFLSLIKKSKLVLIEEFIFDERTAIIKDDSNSAYTNQFIAIFEKDVQKITNVKSSKNILLEIHSDNNDNYSFPFGSEWLYYKLYCGTKISDKILVEVILIATDFLIKKGLIKCWFFIRYSDPDLHIRLRFKLTNKNNLAEVCEYLNSMFLSYYKNRLIWKIQIDTYDREIERYGKSSIELAENLFFNESYTVVNMLSHTFSNEDFRWKFAFRYIDVFLTNFGLTIYRKKDLMENLKISFSKEIGVNKFFKKQLDKKFRELKTSINIILNEDFHDNNELINLNNLIDKNSCSRKQIINDLLRLENKNMLEIKIELLICSFLHMFLNRTFPGKQRLHELVVYDYLWRYYKSEIARYN